MASKTTVVQLNRRVCDSSPPATGHTAAGSRLLTGHTTAGSRPVTGHAAAGLGLVSGPGTPDMKGTSAAVSDKTDTA